MTNEEAKKRLEVWLKCGECPEDKRCYDSYLHSTCEYTDYCNDVSIAEAIKVAIKDLEQKPCDDAISRKAVLEYIEGNEADLWHKSENELVCQDIKALPPVTLQPKTGQWIERFDESGKWFECDQCHTDWGGAVNFCPNCGAKMAEPQESEDKA